MELEFIDELPPVLNRATIDEQRVDELIDSLLANPGQWAKVPYEYLYSDAAHYKKETIQSRCRNFASRINKGQMLQFSEYPIEATTRQGQLYMRMAATKRQLKGMEL